MLYKQQVDWPACLVRSPGTIQYEAVVLRYAPDFKDPWALRSTLIAKLLPSNKGSKIRNRSNMIQFQPKFPRSCCDEDPTNQVLSYRKFTLRSWTMSTMLLFAYNLCFRTRTSRLCPLCFGTQRAHMSSSKPSGTLCISSLLSWDLKSGYH